MTQCLPLLLCHLTAQCLLLNFLSPPDITLSHGNKTSFSVASIPASGRCNVSVYSLEAQCLIMWCSHLIVQGNVSPSWPLLGHYILHCTPQCGVQRAQPSTIAPSSVAIFRWEATFPLCNIAILRCNLTIPSQALPLYRAQRLFPSKHCLCKAQHNNSTQTLPFYGLSC